MLVVILLALFVLVGEGSPFVLLLLYLPRVLWILPGLLLLPFSLRPGRRALLAPLAVGALVWLFPIMGFVPPRPWHRGTEPTIRVLSYNTSHAADGVESLRELVMQTHPDLVLFQWTSHLVEEALSGPPFAGWTVQRAGQFTVATRFPVLSLETCDVVEPWGPPCAHAVLQTPIGTLDVYTVRPQSARFEIGAARHMGIRNRVRGLIRDLASGHLAEITAHRETQYVAIAKLLAHAQHPVLITGDTNLPQNSQFLPRYFGGYRDAFVESSWGFGFTHPSRLPWLRLDRVLLGPGLGASSFKVLSRRSSAHLPVLAEIGRSAN